MKSTTTILFLFNIALLFSQEVVLSGTVRGNGNEETRENATVSIFDANSDQLIKFVKSGVNGNFQISFDGSEIYVVSELFGYKTFKSENFIINNKGKFLNILLEVDSVNLDEVVVMQKNNILKLSRDKMIIDIEKAGFGSGNDALQTLSKLPGVRLDKDENLVFRGNANLQIMIDGKPSLITGEELKQFLKTMDGTNIKKVEIIANPSAKYDASGSAGIFNIVLKKSAANGLTGNVKTSVGYAEFIKNYNGLNLYSNTEKWNFNVGLNYNYSEGVNHRIIDQIVESPAITTELKQYNDWLPISKSYSGNFGVSRKLSENSSIGASANYNLEDSDQLTKGRTNEFDNSIYKRYTILKTDDKVLNKTLTATLFYSFATDSIDTKIDAQLNYANYQNDSDRLTSNSYFDALNNELDRDSDDIKYENPTNFNIVTTKLDVEKKISESVSIEIGAKYSYVNNDYTIILKDRNSEGNYILDESRSNRLIYEESILSGYGIANFSKGKFDIQAGLRAEYINYDATSMTSKTTNTDRYISFFPSFSINGNFDKDQFKISFSRRIQRPRYLYLNPYFEYIDTYNIEVGNPNLTPEFTDAFEIAWINNQKTSLSLYANFSKDEMYQIVDYDEATKITTLYYDNIGKSKNIGISFNTNLSFQKWWDVQFNSEVSYGQAKSDLEGYKFNDSGISYYGGINQSFTIAKDWSATWSSFYSARGDYGNTSFKPSYDISLGMRKDFLNKKLRLNLSAQNILKKSQWRQTMTQDNVTTNWVNRWETRKITLSAVYSFGSAKKKEVKEADLEEEENRL